MSGGHTEKAFESSIEAHLLANGWVQGQAANYRVDLGLDTAVMFEFIGATQAEQWNTVLSMSGSADKAQADFAKQVAGDLSQFGAMHVLRKGVTASGVDIKLAYFRPAHSLTPDLQVLYKANRATVYRQVHHSESKPHDSIDFMLGLNGIPIATAELKVGDFTGQTVEDAKKQYRQDRNANDLIFRARALVHFAFDTDLVYMTTRLAGKDTQFLPFNQGSGGAGRKGGRGNPLNPNGARTAYLWEQVWQRDNWLDLIGRFIQEIKGKGKKSSKPATILFPRYHQWDLVTKLCAHAATWGPGRNYLPQHSAGSGKSNSIAWLAHRLSNLYTPADPALLTDHATKAGLGPNQKVFHKVIIVTDRVVLDKQLRDTVAGFQAETGVVQRIDKDSKQLAEALRSSQGQIIITTLQKFPVIAASATELVGTRFGVIVDEAHSSQSGEAAKGLKTVLGAEAVGTGPTADAAVWDAAERIDAEIEAADDPQDALAEKVSALAVSAKKRGAQPNLSFFAFTATPKQKTLELFGEHIPDPAAEGGVRLEAFHLYSMRQAIEEGFILDVLGSYVTYKTYFRLANGLAADDPEVDKGKANAALAKYVSLHPTNLAQKAEIIVKHFQSVTAPQIGGLAKAMVVTRSRLHAVRYAQAISKYLDEQHITNVKAIVAFSGSVEDPDGTDQPYTEAEMNGFPESQTADRFHGHDPHHPGDYQVLIVAEKYQIGFDEPLLHTMYVDKKLDGVKAVQTLSRLNRIAPGKDSTFVLDFANDAEQIHEAFQPYYETTWAEPTDPNVLFNQRSRIMLHAVINPADMHSAVVALLTQGEKANPVLVSAVDEAAARFWNLDDPEDQDDFRTALRDFVRTYAFLGQIVPFHSEDLEELFYFGKLLITRIRPEKEDGDLDIGEAAVLTHLRTQLIADTAPPLTPGDDQPIPGMHDGRGAQHVAEKVRLSSLIDLLNERFGLNLGEADQVWVDQQIVAAVNLPDLQELALANTEENFGFVFDDRFTDVVIDRQTANGELFNMFFDKPDFQEAMTAYVRREVYRRIREHGGDAA